MAILIKKIKKGVYLAISLKRAKTYIEEINANYDEPNTYSRYHGYAFSLDKVFTRVLTVVVC